jgi:hypothetical protein
MDDFFTKASFATLAGSVAAVLIIINTIHHVFNWGPRWFGLLVSLLIALVAFQTARSLGDATKTSRLGRLVYVIVFLNGCLIYSSAFGVQNSVIAKPDAVVTAQTPKPDRQEESSAKLERPEERAERLTVRSRW